MDIASLLQELLPPGTVAEMVSEHSAMAACDLTGAPFVVELFVNEAAGVASLIVITDLRVVQDNIWALIELITHLNWGLVVGGFELDPQGGDIRFRIGFPMVDRLAEQLHAAWPIMVSTLDASHPGLRDVASGERTLDDVLGGG